MDSKSVQGSKADLDDIDNEDLMASFLTTDAENFHKKIKNNNQTNFINKKKTNNFADKIFDYIHVVQYCQLFSLA